jgi:glutaminyl-peptide cyclotransferase
MLRECVARAEKPRDTSTGFMLPRTRARLMRFFALVLAAVLLAGCGRVDPSPATTTASVVTSTLPVTTTRPVATDPGTFEGQKALERVREQVHNEDGSVRHRVPGTPGNDEAARIIADTMAGLGWTVSWHHFNSTSYACNEAVPMHNVVAERPGVSGKVVLLGAHYDTRSVAEKDANPENRTRPIPGANDGGSGVGVLLELARALNATDDTLRMVFFDGEDGGSRPCADWIIGSRAYATSMTPAEVVQTKAMVLVDMVGDPSLVLPREGNSRQGAAGKVQDRIYAFGGSLGYADVFTNDTKHSYPITDDHVPFRERGIPSVDLIHLIAAPAVFPAWHHTQQDDMSQVSAASLEAVGRTLEAWLEAGAPTS